MDLRPEAVTDQVQRVMGRDDVTVRGVHRLWRPRLASTQGVYRVDLDRVDGCPSALVVKFVDGSLGVSDLPREADLYARDALPTGGEGLGSPRFYGISVASTAGVAIWLELVESSQPGEWSAEIFARVAEHLGHFTGSCPDQTANAARMVRGRDLCGRPDLIERSLALLDDHSTDRLARRAYPADICRGLHRLWEDREPVMTVAASAPHGVCHGDAQRNNLLPQSSRMTTGIDWANLATGPIGLDAATLFHYAIAYFDFDVERAVQLDRAIFDGYIRGLGELGETKSAEIRLAYCTQLAFGLGLLEIGPVLRMISDHDQRETAEAFYRRPLEEILDRRRSLATLLLDFGREALAIAIPM